MGYGRHKQRLFDAHLTLDPDLEERETFESRIAAGIMEGASLRRNSRSATGNS